MNLYDYLSNLYNSDILLHHRVLYIYWFFLGHLLYNLVQFIYDVVIYKLKRYKTRSVLYLFNTSCSATMFSTFICFTYGTRFTIRFNTSWSTSVCYTFIGFTYGTWLASGFNTSCPPTVCYTFIGFAYCAGFTIWFSLYMT